MIIATYSHIYPPTSSLDFQHLTRDTLPTFRAPQHDNEELIDYEDDHEVTTNGAAVTSSTSAVAASASAADGEGDKDIPPCC